MKRSMRRILSVLLAGMLLLLPVMEAAASYDLASGIWPEALFPGESLSGIAPGTLTVDGTPVDVPEDIWTNNESGRVYSVSQDEEGNYSLSTLGYTLTVKSGSSRSEDGDEFSDSEENHRTVSSEESSDGMSADTACYMAGDRVVITADEPEEGMQFAGWTVEPEGSELSMDDPSQSETAITMPDIPEGVVITAQYAEVQPETYMLTVNNGSGSGEYEAGTQIEVTASDRSGEGLQFAGWAVESGTVGLDQTAASVLIEMPAEDVILTAQYAEVQPETYMLTVNNGSGSGEYEAGTQIEVTADDRSGEGLQFAGWAVESGTVGLDQTAASVLIEMPAEDVTLTAQYTEVQEVPSEVYTLTVNYGSGSGTYEAGAQVEVTANDRSGEGLQFAGWVVESGTVSLDPAATSASIEMPAENVILTAQYAEVQEVPSEVYTLTVNGGSGSGTYAAGAQVEVTVNDRSGEGLQFAGWVVESGTVSLDPTAASVSIVMPAENVILTAQYTGIQPETYTLTVNYGSGSGTYEAGAQVEVTASDRSGEGLQFAGWAVESGTVSLDPTAASVSIVMPAENVILTAQYTGIQPETYTLTVNYGSGSGTYAAGAQVEVTASDRSGEGLQFAGWAVESGTVSLDPTAASVSIVMPAENVILTAQYTRVTEDPGPDNSLPQENPPREEEQVYRLTVESGAGSGEYKAGAIVAIEANVKDGMTFSGWVSYNDKAVINNRTEMVTTLIMPAEDVVVAADYVTAQYKVTVDCGDGNPTTNTYVPGETVTLTAPDRKAEKLQFAYWTGTQVIAGTPVALQFTDAKAAETTFTMPQGEVAVYANYTPLPSTYHVTVSNGLINGVYQEMDCAEGDSITVTANPGPEGQQFQMWKVNDGKVNLGDQANSSSITVSVKQNMNFLAVYAGIEYKVTVNEGTGDYKSCTQGTKVTIQAGEAPLGMTFDHWEVDSGNVSLADASQSQTTFEMPSADVEVSAKYRNVQYQLAVENGTSDAQYYYMGDTVKISSNYPAGGRIFGGWVSDGGNVEFEDGSRWTTTFAMPASNVVVRATYADGPSPDSNAIQNLVEGGLYFTGDTIEFTAAGAGMDNANPNPGDYRYRPASYQIGSVTGTWQGSPYTTSMAINAAGDYTLKVIYNKDIYNGSEWQPDGTVDTKSVTFKVSSGRLSVNTGDETPIGLVVGILAASGTIFIILLVLFLKRKKRRK